jgi:hypothetical protein
MSESEQIVGGELVAAEPRSVSVGTQSKPVQTTRPIPRALTLVGAALAFAGREIVPRLAASLLDAWDRRASGATSGLYAPDDAVSATRSAGSGQQPTPGLRGAGGRRHRRWGTRGRW